ncbi:MAG: RIP metalloprotease RseP [Candidatus Delongbacteria bacterium]|jgi:regulator of sigma E protease|nr:RIP metalloprotease RseP [Candidatus Delongbacteria bacterium]
MSGLVMTAQLLLALSILVFVHELGHFLAARLFKIKVDKFFIFFDWPGKIYSKKVGDTEYGVGMLPLGGYVKIAGMIDESMDKEQMKKPPQPWEFRSKPAWQRLIVMVAGVIMNIIAGVMIFTFSHMAFSEAYIDLDDVEDGIYAYEYAEKTGLQNGDKIIAIDGKEVNRISDVISTRLYFGNEVKINRNGKLMTIALPDTLYRYVMNSESMLLTYQNYPLEIEDVPEGYNAHKAGLRETDEIISINSQPVSLKGEYMEMLLKNRGDTLEMTVNRRGDPVTLSIPVDSSGTVGIRLKSKYPTTEYTFFTAMKYGWKDAFESLKANAKGMGKVFSGEEKARDSLQGPIGIAKTFGGTWHWGRFWMLTGIISMVLAFVNILPIPALDGGHVLFTLIEMIIGRKLPDRFMEIVQTIGLIIVLGLMILIIGNDIINLF